MENETQNQPIVDSLREVYHPEAFLTELAARRYETDALRHRPHGLASIATEMLTEAILCDPHSIYGPDDHVDVYQVTDSDVLTRIAGTVAITYATNLTDQGNGTYALTIQPLTAYIAQQYGEPLCSSEKFANQPAGPWCTGFFITPSCVLTAGHCIKNRRVCTGSSNSPDIVRCTPFLPLVRRTISLRIPWAELALPQPQKKHRCNVLVNSAKVEHLNYWSSEHPRRSRLTILESCKFRKGNMLKLLEFWIGVIQCAINFRQENSHLSASLLSLFMRPGRIHRAKDASMSNRIDQNDLQPSACGAA